MSSGLTGIVYQYRRRLPTVHTWLPRFGVPALAGLSLATAASAAGVLGEVPKGTMRAPTG
jgi:hypothetical protein